MIFAYSLGHCQVGIVTNNPDKNSILDLTGFNNKGLNLPKVALSSKSSPSPLTTHVAGMMVYNTATVGSGTDAVKSGVYVNDGSRWMEYVKAATTSEVREGAWLIPSSNAPLPGMKAAQLSSFQSVLPAGVYRFSSQHWIMYPDPSTVLPAGSVYSCSTNQNEWVLDISAATTVKWRYITFPTSDSVWSCGFQCIKLY